MKLKGLKLQYIKKILSSGEPGLLGAKGEPGKDGSDGRQGDQGNPGESGPAGKTGAVGPPGKHIYKNTYTPFCQIKLKFTFLMQSFLKLTFYVV